MAGLFFYIFAFLILTGSICVIGSRNPVHAVLWLIFTFCNGAGLMVLMGAEFIAMMLIIIYVGAVAVLFLFVVMMLNIEYSNMVSLFRKNLWFIVFISLLLFADLALVILVSVQNDASSISLPMQNNLTDVQMIGRVLYTDFILPFQMSGLVLLLAMIASIALTLRARKGVKRQDIAKQLARNKDNSVKMASNNGKMGLDNIAYDD